MIDDIYKVFKKEGILWYWHRCKTNRTEATYYMACMGEYNFVIREFWSNSGPIKWETAVTKWNNYEQIYVELMPEERHVEFKQHREAIDAMMFIQNWYETYVLGDQVLLGEIK